MKDLVEKISQLKYEINNTLKIQERPIIFQPSNDDYIRRQTLGKPCLIESELKDFATKLYNVVYEETKVNSLNKVTLGKYANYDFTFYVSELRHYYDHGFAEYVSNKKIKIKHVFQKYLNKQAPPKTTEEFQAIQKGILIDFIDFLNEIDKSLLKECPPANISLQNYKKGIIEIDQKGFVHCNDVLLLKNYSDYVGKRCVILRFIPNSRDDTQNEYPFFSKGPLLIEVDIQGSIEIDNDGNCHCENILLPKELNQRINLNIHITEIKSLKSEGNYRFTASKYQLQQNSEGLESEKNEISYQTPFSLGEKVIVECDPKSRLYVGNIYIGKKQDCKKGELIKIIKVTKSAQKHIYKDYPWTAILIEKINDNEDNDIVHSDKKDLKVNNNENHFIPSKERESENEDPFQLNFDSLRTAFLRSFHGYFYDLFISEPNILEISPTEEEIREYGYMVEDYYKGIKAIKEFSEPLADFNAYYWLSIIDKILESGSMDSKALEDVIPISNLEAYGILKNLSNSNLNLALKNLSNEKIIIFDLINTVRENNFDGYKDVIEKNNLTSIFLNKKLALIKIYFDNLKIGNNFISILVKNGLQQDLESVHSAYFSRILEGIPDRHKIYESIFANENTEREAFEQLYSSLKFQLYCLMDSIKESLDIINEGFYSPFNDKVLKIKGGEGWNFIQTLNLDFSLSLVNSFEDIEKHNEIMSEYVKILGEKK